MPEPTTERELRLQRRNHNRQLRATMEQLEQEIAFHQGTIMRLNAQKQRMGEPPTWNLPPYGYDGYPQDMRRQRTKHIANINDLNSEIESHTKDIADKSKQLKQLWALWRFVN